MFIAGVGCLDQAPGGGDVPLGCAPGTCPAEQRCDTESATCVADAANPPATDAGGPTGEEPADAGGGVTNDDQDGDEIPDDGDTCPGQPDPEQVDSDGDGLGDLCDPNPLRLDVRLHAQILLLGGPGVDTLHRVVSAAGAGASRSENEHFILNGSLSP